MASVYHEGELAVQAIAGETSMAERNGSVISGRIMGGALPFLEKQPMAALAYQDRDCRVWVSILFGRPGFIRSADGSAVDIDTTAIAVQMHDPIWASIGSGTPAGMIVIELSSRRRIRINGDLTQPSENSLRLVVRESYPNCPKFITRRSVRTGTTEASSAQAFCEGTSLSVEQTATVESADVFFIGTAHADRGFDASHRGGFVGFVEVLDAQTLRIPDYQGNSMFNTLGNLAADARAGITIPDFGRSVVLRLSGRAETLWNQPDEAGLSGGTHRFLQFHIESWTEEALPPGVQTELFDYSPFNPVPAPHRY